MHGCDVMPPRIATLIDPLRAFLAALDMRERMPQIEVALGKVETGEVLALVFRVLEPPTPADREALIAFARTHRFELWLQPKGPDTVHLVWAPQYDGAQTPASRLAYTLPEFDVRMPFRPTDFTQVNHRVNEMLVGHALRLLEPQPTDRIAVLFCGLGNFSLPLARRARAVVGVEGSAALVARATENARANGLSERTDFQVANLFELDDARWRALGPFDRVLIDPPREGALELAKALASDAHKPQRIVYVSCNPATLARDAGLLVNTGGFALLAAGAVACSAHLARRAIAVSRRPVRTYRKDRNEQAYAGLKVLDFTTTIRARTARAACRPRRGSDQDRGGDMMLRPPLQQCEHRSGNSTRAESVAFDLKNPR
jgi:23S rRNA (uracil1939-C5)-methyltransferase